MNGMRLFDLVDGRFYEDSEHIATVVQDDRTVSVHGTGFVYVQSGAACIRGGMLLKAGMYAAVPSGIVTALGQSTVVVVDSMRHNGVLLAGGPIEWVGRLRYIDGCSDSLLLSPMRKGDPCLNFLHIPGGISQTAHTHPSVRIGIVARGFGKCWTPGGTFDMAEGMGFVIPQDTLHAFRTEDDVLDVVVFHPDSVEGPTDERHQMLSATLVK